MQSDAIAAQVLHNQIHALGLINHLRVFGVPARRAEQAECLLWGGKNGFTGKSATTSRLTCHPSASPVSRVRVSNRVTPWSSFLSFSANSSAHPLYLSVYVTRVPLPRLARLRSTYFFSILTICLIYTNSSAPRSSPCFLTDLALSLMNTTPLFFFSSPSAKMPTIKDPYIN